MDVKTVFLNGDLEEEIYMDQPEGFVEPGQESKACKLTKSLYGLKQAPKQWHEKFDSCMIENDYCKVEFIQSFCWLYSVLNLLVIQHLKTLYLGGNHVRVVCERV